MAKTGGGSRKGKPNKTKVAKLLKIREYCDAKGYDPLHAMVDLATAPDKDKLALDIKLACHKELAKYLHPQLSRREIELGEHARKAIRHLYGKS